MFKSLRDTYCRVKHLENEGKLRRISNANTKCHYMYKNVPVAESTQSCLGLFIKLTIYCRFMAVLRVIQMLELRELL